MITPQNKENIIISLKIFTKNRASVVGIIIIAFLLLLVLFTPFLTSYDPLRTGVAARLIPPGGPHLMGTDDLGRDVFARVLSGIRISLLVGVSSAIVSALIGTIIGGIAGFFKGWVDDLLMRFTEIFMVIPRFFMAILLVSIFGAKVEIIIISIAILSWPQIARLTRSEFIILRERQFVDGARLSGSNNFGLIFKEILPNAMGSIIVNATLQVGQAILLEAGLSYLGLGDFRQVSLGSMLYRAQGLLRIAWWTSIFPGVMIFLAVLGINLVGDGLNDVLNPKSKGR